MCLHPRAQQRAQEEIDRVVGSEKLPTFEDRPNLPFVDACVKEVLRYWTIAPIGQYCHAQKQEFESLAHECVQVFPIEPQRTILMGTISYPKVSSNLHGLSKAVLTMNQDRR